MKKAQGIFLMILTVMILIMSGSIDGLYDNVREHKPKNAQDDLPEYVEHQLTLLAVALAEKVDPSYEPLQFDPQISQESQAEIKHVFNSTIEQIKRSFDDDIGFAYVVSSLRTDTRLSLRQELLESTKKKEDYVFYREISFGEQGNATCSDGSIIEDRALLQDIFELTEDNYGMTEYLILSHSKVSLNDVRVVFPSQIEVTYAIPETVMESGFLSSYVDHWDTYNGFTACAMVVTGIVLAVFLLAYPIKIVENCPPYRTIKQWKGEIALPLLVICLGLGMMACLIVTGYSLNGALIAILKNYHIQYEDVLVYLANILTWSITMLVFTLVVFCIKYIFAHGLIRYLKEDTFIGTFGHYLKRKGDQLLTVDLAQPLNQTIIKVLLGQLLVMICLIALSGLGCFLAFLYTGFLFFWIRKQVDRIQGDYQQVLLAADALSNGHFDAMIEKDVGLFNQLKTKLNLVKEGFEKAVKEETKSQKMKTELISNVSHDLKTPLTCIKNYIVLLKATDLTETQRSAYLGSLEQYSDRLMRLIEDLFEISKANSGNISINCVSLNLVALLEQSLAENQEIIDSRQLTVIRLYQMKDLPIELDGDKTYRIFENLFTNIGKYAMTNSRVYLDILEQTDQVKVIFKNISEVQMNFTPEEITERFVRGDKSRHETGSGLGLAIAKSFTEAQGGQFQIDIDGDLFKVILTFNK